MKTRKSKTPVAYPFVQRTPNGAVKIYKSAGASERYYVTWVDAEKGRSKRSYTDEAEAHQRAEEILDDLRKAMSVRSEVTAVQAVRVTEYEQMLKPFGVSLGDAVRHFLAHLENEKTKRMPAEDAVEEYLKTIEAKTSRHHQTARCITRRFARHFKKNMCDVKVTELDQYLRSVSASGRTRNNHLSGLRTFFRWAQKWRGYLPKGDLEIDLLPEYPESAVKVDVFTPDEMRRLLENAPTCLRPYLAIGAFAGVRCAEIGRLKWENIDLEHKVIELDASITKTKRRRLALMPDNLVEWLKLTPEDERKGAVMQGVTKMHKDRWALRDATGVEWKKNGLRKSYISYRMAQPDWDAAKVAKQCGNSSAMVEENYKGLVMPQAAEKWFSIAPTT